MGRIRLYKFIHGVVFYDENSNDIRDKSEQPLEGVAVNIYRIEEIERKSNDAGESMTIYGEKPAGRVITNARGEYSLLVREGTYSVNLDVDTLPVGKGVNAANRLIEAGSQKSIDFPVKNIAEIQTGDDFKSIIYSGDYVILRPTCKDSRGNNLTANIRLFSEDDEVDAEVERCFIKPKTLKERKIVVHIDAGELQASYPIKVKPPEISSVERVNLAYEMGMIDEQSKYRILLQALSADRGLPDEYRSRVPVKSGTPVAEELKRYIDRQDADPVLAERIKRFFEHSVPKLERVYVSPSGFFKIHYTTTGPNSVASRRFARAAVPEYIRSIGKAFDHVKKITCDERGFRTPLTDPGKKHMDIYVYDLKGKYGVTFSSKIYTDNENKIRRASSYICIDNSYSASKGFDKSRDECMMVTAAHEFFHAVQYAYNVDADSWWKEASATWNEDEVYSGINDYIRYLDKFFSSPQNTLEKSSYGGVVFAKYLSENFGGYEMIKRIWEYQASGIKNSVNAIERAIKNSSFGDDFGTVFDRFTAYNFKPEQYYKEGHLWKTKVATQGVYNAYPVAGTKNRLDHLAANYFLFEMPAELAGKNLKISIESSDPARWGFKIQKKKASDEKCIMEDITVDGRFSRSGIIINDPAKYYKEICFIPANLEKERDGLAYAFSADILD